MDLVCQDRHLNISVAYLRPGFAFGVSAWRGISERCATSQGDRMFPPRCCLSSPTAIECTWSAPSRSSSPLVLDMGLLPAFRGMNVLEWSLFYEEPIGVTLHLIERGIDTGDILAFKEIPLEEGDTIATLRAKSLVVSVSLMAECIESLRLGRLTRTKQRPQDGRQYFVMHPRLKAVVESRLKHPTQQIYQTSLHA